MSLTGHHAAITQAFGVSHVILVADTAVVAQVVRRPLHSRTDRRLAESAVLHEQGSY